MTRSDYVLAVLAAVFVPLTAVEVQRLFLILDMKIAAQVGGPFFTFAPGGIAGPFSQSVCDELRGLSERGLASVHGSQTQTYRLYSLDCAGIEPGADMVSKFPELRYAREVIAYLRATPHPTALGAIYAERPEMRAS